MNINIVTRKSRLALQQTNIVKELLQQHHPHICVNLLPISTQGDEILDKSLIKIGGKGLFVEELEHRLSQGIADLAVHSAKDMPVYMKDGMIIGAVLPRADPRDVFVSDKFCDISALPVGAIVGTSSLRRQAQILHIRPDLEVKNLRGNVETRIKKLLNEEYDAIVLAYAGLQRLGLDKWTKTPFSVKQMLPAVAQGALVIEIHSARLDLAKIIQPLHDIDTATCITAERSLNSTLDGGCQAPVAGLAKIEGDQVYLCGLVASIDGKTILKSSNRASFDNAALLGEAVANDLIKQGAADIIEDAKKLWT